MTPINDIRLIFKIELELRLAAAEIFENGTIEMERHFWGRGWIYF